jgi:DNA modification methylase
MTPRREVIGDCELWLGDCRDVLPTLDHSSAVVADPPYGIGYRHSGKGAGFPSDRKAPARRHGRVAVVGDKDGIDPSSMLSFREAVIWGANHFADQLPASSRWLVWDKRDGMDSNSFADCELAWCSLPGAARLFRYMWNGICKAGEHGESRVHPMQKPIAVMQWSIGFTSAQTVVDPYMGSATTALACMREGRAFIGIEIDQRWFEIGLSRIEQVYRQGDLIRDIYEKPKQQVLL